MMSDAAAVPRLVVIDRRQMLLRTVDVEKLVDDEHGVRSIWELVGRLDLRHYHEQIAAVEGSAGREHTDPQLLISLWLYAYSRGVSSARELARQCEYEPGCQWLCALHPVSHRTLSGFRSENKAALDDLFAQVLGMLSAEGLITLERVTLDGTKIKANAGGNTFRRREKLAAHLAAAREQVRILNEQAEREEQLTKRQAAARRRAARQRASRLEAAVREVERLQRERVHERKTFVARASSSDPEATSGDQRVQGQNEDRSRAAHLRATLAHCGVRACLDQRTLRPTTISLSRAAEDYDGSAMGLLEL